MGLYAMTGGATGIGAAIRQQLVAARHEVIVVDIKDADIVADLSTADGRAAAVAGIRERAPQGLDGFIPCAGVGPQVAPPSLVAKINYFGTVATFEGVVELVEKRDGSVVFISSNSAPMGADERCVELMLAGDEEGTSQRLDELGDGQNAYAGSKLAVTRYMRRHAVDYVRRGVRLNAVAPGFTHTPLTAAGLKDEQFGPAIREFIDTIPAGRAGQPEDIANAVSFLLGEQAAFVCGAVLFVDGGHDAMLRPDQF